MNYGSYHRILLAVSTEQSIFKVSLVSMHWRPLEKGEEKPSFKTVTAHLSWFWINFYLKDNMLFVAGVLYKESNQTSLKHSLWNWHWVWCTWVWPDGECFGAPETKCSPGSRICKQHIPCGGNANSSGVLKRVSLPTPAEFRLVLIEAWNSWGGKSLFCRLFPNRYKN